MYNCLIKNFSSSGAVFWRLFLSLFRREIVSCLSSQTKQKKNEKNWKCIVKRHKNIKRKSFWFLSIVSNSLALFLASNSSTIRSWKQNFLAKAGRYSNYIAFYCYALKLKKKIDASRTKRVGLLSNCSSPKSWFVRKGIGNWKKISMIESQLGKR